MKSKYLLILLVIASGFVLTACTSSPNQNNDIDQKIDEDISTVETPKQQDLSSNKNTEINNVLNVISKATGLTAPSEMRIRRRVDSLSLDDEGRGFLVRLASTDQKLTTYEELISVEMTGLNYEVQKFEPKSSSLVTKFYKFNNKDVECTLEIRKVGTTAQSDLSFGCL